MKRLIPLILVLCLMLCACNSSVEEETTIPAEETTAEANEVSLINPLTGEYLGSEYNGRVFAVTINNVSVALPHRGVADADVYFELLVNDYCTRGLALFSDVSKISDVGSIRSTRYNFTDIAQSFDAVLVHANCSDVVRQDMNASGIDEFSADSEVGYRDSDRRASGYSYEHTLFVTGESMLNHANESGIRLTTEKEYGFKFATEGTPVNGEDAAEIEICFTLSGQTKKTVMKYDATTDLYVYNQYGKEMADDKTGEKEGFKNVFVIHAPTENQGVYHVANLIGSGDGYFACGGKIIPMKWIHAAETDSFTFTLTDGTPLYQEAGSSYIAIAPTGSAVNY